MQKIDIIKIYQRKSALVIDDYPDMHGSIRRMLVNFGITELHTVSSGSEAITACENNHYDIILCHYNLGDGKNERPASSRRAPLPRLLKRTTAYRMISAETTNSMVFGTLEYQPDDYLTKPFTQTELQRRLDRLVLEKEELREINRAIDEQDYDRAIALCDEQINAKSRYEQKCYRIKTNCFLDKHLFPQAPEIFEDVLDERRAQIEGDDRKRIGDAEEVLDHLRQCYRWRASPPAVGRDRRRPLCQRRKSRRIAQTSRRSSSKNAGRRRRKLRTSYARSGTLLSGHG
jgi:CheY-like chemotaxis protein